MSDEQKKKEQDAAEKPATEEKKEEATAEATPEAAEKPAAEAKDDSVEEKTEAAPAEATEESTEPSEEEKKIAEEEAERKRQEEEEKLAAEEAKIDDLRPGMTVRVHQKIVEGEKSRVQVFQGIIIAMRGKNKVEKTITVQKKSFGVMVEKIFPLASPLIEKIEVVKIAKVRRAKLYYLRDYGKRLKETLVKE